MIIIIKRQEAIHIFTYGFIQLIPFIRCRKFPPPISKIIIIDDYQSLIISIEISCFRTIMAVRTESTTDVYQKIFSQPFLLTNLYNHMIHFKDFFNRECNGRCRVSFFRFSQLAIIFYTKNRKMKLIRIIFQFHTNNFALFHTFFEHNNIHSILFRSLSPIHSAEAFFSPILIKIMAFQNICVITI